MLARLQGRTHKYILVAQLSTTLPDIKFLNYVTVPLPEKLKSLEAEVFKAKKTSQVAKDLVGACGWVVCQILSACRTPTCTEYLIKQNELKLLPKVAADFHKVVAFSRNEMVVTITSAAVRM